MRGSLEAALSRVLAEGDAVATASDRATDLMYGRSARSPNVHSTEARRAHPVRACPFGAQPGGRSHGLQMKERLPSSASRIRRDVMRRTLLICAFIASFAVVASAAVSAAPVTPIYNNIPTPLPGNLPSWGFEATGTQEFGDRVGFTTTARRLVSVTQTMSSWACQLGHWYDADCATAPGATFTHSVTMNLYNVAAGAAPGTLIGTKTQTFVMPYRPSTDPIHCTGCRWYDGTDCFNGKAFTITFDFSSQNLTLPNQVIFGVAYNTTHHGYTPMGETAACFIAPPPSGGCPYDSLNAALAAPATTLSAG